MCFRAIKTQNKKLKMGWETIHYFPREGGGGGYPSMENSMKIINFFFEAFPNASLTKLWLQKQFFFICPFYAYLSHCFIGEFFSMMESKHNMF